MCSFLTHSVYTKTMRQNYDAKPLPHRLHWSPVELVYRTAVVTFRVRYTANTLLTSAATY